MCGIAGLINRDCELGAAGLDARARTMAAALAHRGPDGAGVWVDVDSGYAIGHRRLSIIDTTAAGAQPMRSASGRFVLGFNGDEGQQPRTDLAHYFVTYTDTGLGDALDQQDHGLNYKYLSHFSLEKPESRRSITELSGSGKSE